MIEAVNPGKETKTIQRLKGEFERLIQLCEPVDEEEFFLYMARAVEPYSEEVPPIEEASVPLHITNDETGETEEIIKLTDHPINRFMLQVYKKYDPESEQRKIDTFQTRLFSYLNLLNSGLLDEYVNGWRLSEDQKEKNMQAIIRLCASSDLSAQVVFDIDLDEIDKKLELDFPQFYRQPLCSKI